MEFDKEEFDSLTYKLEQYASKISMLETRIEAQQEIDLLKRDLEQAQQELEEIRKERDVLKQDNCELHERCEILSQQITKAAVENAWLTNCILLSLANIKAFMRLIKRVEIKSLFFAFLHKTILPEMGPRAIQAIDDSIDITDVGELEKLADQLIMQNHGTVEHQ